jgi:glucan phosphoethanolaminetransferase (alkaline phosphatase superfamily)
METIDNSQNQFRTKKTSWSIRLFIIGLFLMVVTFTIAIIWERLGLTSDQTIWLALSLTLVFGFNFLGLILGFFEFRRSRQKAIFGIVGNLVLIGFFVSLVIYSLLIY